MKNIGISRFVLFFSVLLLLGGCAGRSYQSNAIHNSIVSELLPLARDSREAMAEKAEIIYGKHCGKTLSDYRHLTGCLALKQLIIYGYGEDGDIRALGYILGLEADGKDNPGYKFSSSPTYIFVNAGQLPWNVEYTYPNGSDSEISSAGKAFKKYNGYLALINIAIKHKRPELLKYVYYYYFDEQFLYPVPQDKLKEFSTKAGIIGGDRYRVGIERFNKDIMEKMVLAQSKIWKEYPGVGDQSTRDRLIAALYDNAISEMEKRSDIAGREFFIEFLKE